MQFERFLRDLTPLAAVALAGMTRNFGEHSSFRTATVKTARPLAELDLTGEAPRIVKLAGPDLVRVTQGDDFSISVEGDQGAKDRLRFLLEDGTLSILRSGTDWTHASIATINVTMPKPRGLVLAGSGTIKASKLAKNAAITLAGSGVIETTGIAAKRLDISIAGSGIYRASGSAQKLRAMLAGSGNAEMAGLKADDVKISLVGSGDAAFASDGEVRARIMGSGNVTVRGSARCTVKSLGSGTLICERGETGESG